MSNALAIAAVTSALRNILQEALSSDVPGTIVTTLPPDTASKEVNEENQNQVNLFLFHAEPNASWRNMDVPLGLRPGETGQMPLAITLFYLLTAYFGETGDSIVTDSDRLMGSHRLLGRAMSALHERPILNAATINAALPPTEQVELPFMQVENVRITWQPTTVEDMSRLWTIFQTPYRISVVYEVCLVLIESLQPAKTPLPVLTLGPDDRGPRIQPSLVSPFPTMISADLPNPEPAIRLGETLTLKGQNLAGTAVELRFLQPRLTEPISVTTLLASSDTEIQVSLPAPDNPDNPDPDAPANWPAGCYTVSAVIALAAPENPQRTTNTLPFALAPRILTLDPTSAPPGDLTLTLTVEPQIRAEQRVALLLGDREILVQVDTEMTDTLTVEIQEVSAGDYFVRLRVDGVDSLLVVLEDLPQPHPVFDDSLKVTIG